MQWRRPSFVMLVCGVFVLMHPPPSHAADAFRVSNGLTAFYTFEAERGDTIKDRSGNGKPLDLKIEKASAVAWGEGVLEVRSATKIESIGSAGKLVGQAKRANALTVEAWIKPRNTSQKGPARIVSLSNNSVQRNLTLGQEADHYQVRLRTTATSDNGLPETNSGTGKAETKLAHVVFTRASDGSVRFYVDGRQTASKKVSGTLANWDGDFPLVLVNERSLGRPWLGELHLVAIYSRALSGSDVSQNFRAGPNAGVDPHETQRLAMARAEQTFATKVAPLLARRCLECHDSTLKKGDLDLSHKLAALAGGESGRVIVPGSAESSLLWDQIESGDMPPQGPGLSAAERASVKGWIDGGAVWSIDRIDPAVYASNPGASDSWVQRLTTSEYIETVRSAVGVDISKEAKQMLPPDLRADGFSNTAYNLNVDLKHIEAYSQLAEKIVQQMDILEFSKRFSKSQSLNTDATARDLVAKTGEWLFRGPLDEREVSNYSGVLTAVASAGGSFEQGVGLMLEAMLQSPRFIYRIEQQPSGGGSQRVSDFELASRMSYILWGGPPDSELLKAAREGRLADEGRCRKEVERMLQDRRAVERSKQFATDWLNLNRLAHLQPNQKRYPQWTAELGRDMRDETLAYFEEVVWKQGRPLNELFDAQFTYATPRLAKHYGLKPQGDGLRRYDLSDQPARGGLLTQGSVLTIGGDDASMVTRGLFVMRDLLRGVMGAPPPGVDTTPVPPKPGVTHRDVAEDRIRSESCGGCHIKFEPLAFGLEPFDGLGAFHRQDEFGNALRSDGQLVIPGKAKPQKYETPAELMKLLSSSDRVRQTLTWKVTQFALGRPLGARDATEVQRIHQAASTAGGRYTDLITAVVMSDLVQEARSPDEP
ncbi:putative signal peptide protein [Rhodopirellula islandica]|uniref:Signal peptide protein n=1 Tax=Rhodopirellula islandica TaxID=595434 RepID=A0A0J1BB70_RHOIS|nr:DUF1592 domain-containing protein [Rhodopirellula islandica]KLU03798.1 putative signal peptide protein [Rhodopirellula islandica]